MGESVTEGTISRWLKAVGDSVTEGESVVEVTTDKVDVEVPSPAEGTLEAIVAQEGDTVTVGATLATIAAGANGANAATAAASNGSAEAPAPAFTPKAQEQPDAAEADQPPPQS
ncbi:MAG: 2-oxoglutarate dehydrogenase, E2 component, dihydrolipoamide succinyltransferase, partial [Candidatus Dormibacteraeota bacterium]|nr:2-oxoglutarate dehydrogenase, E2 component, dihydrolipoamide succinyltransferase [Candidatus Dormibacteraeota bacterium]